MALYRYISEVLCGAEQIDEPGENAQNDEPGTSAFAGLWFSSQNTELLTSAR